MTTATLLTVAQLREHYESSLSDAALQRLLDAAESEIIRLYGPHATATEVLPGNGEWLVLERPAASITSITETVGDDATVLAANDYMLWGGARLERDADGTHGAHYWGEQVSVSYIPADMVAQRTMVLVQLVKLDAEYSGHQQESVGGDHSETNLDYVKERAKLLNTLSPRGGVVFA